MNACQPQPLDRDAVEYLAAEFMDAIVAHYRSRPTARSTAQEILNALASSAALVIHGTGSDESVDEALLFFHRAIDQQLEDLEKS